MEPRVADIAIIGAGIAGATLAAALGNACKTLILEAEDHPGYHATGRSAAFWSESYGGPAIQPLTSASFDGLAPYLGQRGCLHIADEAGQRDLAALAEEFAGRPPDLRPMGRDDLAARVPGLSASFTQALEEPSCRDIDVARYHADALAGARRDGTAILTRSAVVSLTREGEYWRISTRSGEVKARIVVNAAGAWAGGIAAMAGAASIPITPYRRTVIQLATDPPMASDMSLVMDAAGRFYFKPEAGGRLWLSPHDETETVAQDAAPDEWDIAVAIDRFERAVNWTVLRRERAWAGLRSFAPDRVPVYGFDRLAPGFFWFAGQGGFGIQTAPAAAAIGAALLLEKDLPDWMAAIDIERYAAHRFA